MHKICVLAMTQVSGLFPKNISRELGRSAKPAGHASTTVHAPFNAAPSGPPPRNSHRNDAMHGLVCHFMGQHWTLKQPVLTLAGNFANITAHHVSRDTNDKCIDAQPKGDPIRGASNSSATANPVERACCRSMTYNQRRRMTKEKVHSRRTVNAVYFCDCTFLAQLGLNENTNGLHLPRGTEL